MNRLLYTLLLHLALPLIALRLALRARKAPAYARRIHERFALGLPPMKPGGIWVHAVSVGESIAAAPMIRALQTRHPELPITVTCMTPTGSERVRAVWGRRVEHVYLPYDLSGAVRRFLGHFRPAVGLIVETELWPNLLFGCRDRGIPTDILNARLSARSLRGYRVLAPLIRRALRGMA